MRFIPTKFHAPLDYIVGAALIAAPWIFRFSEHTAATIVPIVLGIGLIAYSLFTNYELGVWKVAPMAVHNLRRPARRPQKSARRGGRRALVHPSTFNPAPREGLMLHTAARRSWAWQANGLHGEPSRPRPWSSRRTSARAGSTVWARRKFPAGPVLASSFAVAAAATAR